jgi:hypothetical protein
MKRPDHGTRVTQKMAEEMVAALEDLRLSSDHTTWARPLLQYAQRESGAGS